MRSPKLLVLIRHYPDSHNERPGCRTASPPTSSLRLEPHGDTMTQPSIITPGTHEADKHANGATCQHCLVPPPTNRSAKIAWIVAGVAIALLLAVFFIGGAGSSGGTLLAGAGGITLLALLACPLTMGAMMWYMNRNKH